MYVSEDVRGDDIFFIVDARYGLGCVEHRGGGGHHAAAAPSGHHGSVRHFYGHDYDVYIFVAPSLVFGVFPCGVDHRPVVFFGVDFFHEKF